MGTLDGSVDGPEMPDNQAVDQDSSNSSNLSSMNVSSDLSSMNVSSDSNSMDISSNSGMDVEISNVEISLDLNMSIDSNSTQSLSRTLS